jgi:hypothetical protein
MRRHVAALPPPPTPPSTAQVELVQDSQHLPLLLHALLREQQKTNQLLCALLGRAEGVEW